MHMHMHMHIVHDMMCMCMCVMHMHIKQPNKKHLNSQVKYALRCGAL